MNSTSIESIGVNTNLLNKGIEKLGGKDALRLILYLAVAKLILLVATFVSHPNGDTIEFLAWWDDGWFASMAQHG
jgi:hypothetical protein